MNAQLIITLAATLVVSSAFAGNWVEIETDPQESVSIDESSLKISGDEVEVKVLRSYAHTHLNLLDGEWYAFRSQVAIYSVECKEGKLGYVEWVLHHGGQGKGRAVHKGKVTGVLSNDAPTNQGDKALIQSVCTSQVAISLNQAQLVAELAR